MLIYALVYWSLILFLGIFFSLKVLNKFYKLIIIVCRKWIVTRIIIALPLRMVVNTIASAGIGIMIFFHVFFFVAIIGFIYGATGGRSRIVIDILAYTCVASLFLPIVYVIMITFLEEIKDFKKARELE